MVSILLGAAVFALDFFTKQQVIARMQELDEIKIIPGFFSLQFVYNPGAAFGMLKEQRWLFIAVTLVAIGGMLYTVFRRPEARERLVGLALGLLLGGAAGNLVDRIRFGPVVDFLLFYWRQYQFPNFNVADMAITGGVGILILHLMLNGDSEQHDRA